MSPGLTQCTHSPLYLCTLLTVICALCVVQVTAWKASLKESNPKAAESIADPVDYPNLFDNLEYAMKAEEWLQGHKLHEAPASIYPDHALDNESDLLEHMRTLATQQPEEAAAGEAAGGAPEATGGEEVAADDDDDGAEPPMLDAAEEVAEEAAAPEEAEAPKPEEADAAPQAVDLEAELAASLGADGDEADLDAELDAELS